MAAEPTWLEIAQVASSIFAGAGLLVASYQMYTATRVADRSRRLGDLQALHKFYDHALERERALRDAETPDEREFAFNEFLMFLELYAFAHNRGLYGEGSEELVRHKLIDSFNVLNEAKEWHLHIQKAVDTSTTMSELRQFCEHHRDEILRRAEERCRQQAALDLSLRKDDPTP